MTMAGEDMFDKSKTCQNCPDRTSTGCHATCPGYIERAEKNRLKREARFRQSEAANFRYAVKSKIVKLHERR